MSIKTADYILVGIILLLSLAGFGSNLQDAGAASHKYALIHVRNEQVAELSLVPGDSFNYELRFGANGEHTAVVEVKDGRVRMLPLSEDLCPRQICSHTGWIEHSYESIVCLPNQIMITFNQGYRGDDSHDLDGVTY